MGINSAEMFNEPLLVTGGYDHTIKIWQPYSGNLKNDL